MWIQLFGPLRLDRLPPYRFTDWKLVAGWAIGRIRVGRNPIDIHDHFQPKGNIPKHRNNATQVFTARVTFDQGAFYSSTASESMSNKMSAPLIRSENVSKARTAASISTGTIWALRWSHRFFTLGGTTAVNCRGALSRKFSGIGSGVKPSVKMTASTTFLETWSMGPGGGHCWKAQRWIQAKFVPQILPLTNHLKEGAVHFAPELWSTKQRACPWAIPLTLDPKDPISGWHRSLSWALLSSPAWSPAASSRDCT